MTIPRSTKVSWFSEHCLLQTNANRRKFRVPPRMHANRDNCRIEFYYFEEVFREATVRSFPLPTWLVTLLGRRGLSDPILLVGAVTWDFITGLGDNYLHTSLLNSWRDKRRRIPRQRRIGIALGGSLIWMMGKGTLYIHIRIGWITLISSGWGTSDAPTTIFLGETPVESRDLENPWERFW